MLRSFSLAAWVDSCSVRFSASARKARPSQRVSENGVNVFESLMFSSMGSRYDCELGEVHGEYDVGGEEDGDVQDEYWFEALMLHCVESLYDGELNKVDGDDDKEVAVEDCFEPFTFHCVGWR